MKKTKNYVLIILVMLFTGFCQAQEPIKELQIGGKLPDMVLGKLIGARNKKIKLVELYKKGGLIIDFWATWCSPCIKELSVADTLANRYGNLSVLAVSHDDSLKTEHFLNSHREISKSHLIITCDDKLLSQYFKHKTIPHMIWVGKDGVIKLIAGEEVFNERNVKNFLDEGLVTGHIKKDDVKFNWSKPYHVEDSVIEYRSIITHFNDSISGGMVWHGPRQSRMIKRFFAWNCEITRLYWVAFVKQFNIIPNWNYIELHTSDSSRFFYPENNKLRFARSKYYDSKLTFDENRRRWMSDNVFCYELRLPREVPDSLFSQYMFDDLNRYFNINGKVEYRNRTCPILTLNSNFDSLNIKRFIPEPGYVFNAARSFLLNGNKLSIKDRTLPQIIAYLADTFFETDTSTIPLINETGINYPLTMSIELPTNGQITPQLIYQKLAEQGLTFRLLERLVPVLVLNDSNE